MKQPLIPVAAIVSAGFLPLNLLPFTVVELTGALHLSASEAGLVGTIELTGAIFGSLAAMTLVTKISRNRIGVAAMISGALFYLLACAFHTMIALGVVLFLAGAACGAALAAGNALAASIANPAPFYIRVLALESGFAMVIWSLTPMLMRIGNQYGVFIGAAAMLFALALTTVLTKCSDRPTHLLLTARDKVRVSPQRAQALIAIVALAAIFLCCLRDGLAWTLADKIAADLGLTDANQTVLFAAIGLLGLIGLFASARLNFSRHPVFCILVSVGLASTVTTGLLFSSRASIYVLLAIPWAAVQFLALSFLTSLAADIDPSGRVSAAAGAAFQCAYAVAPLLAGATLVRFGYGAVGVLSAILSLLTMLGGGWAAAHLIQQRFVISGIPAQRSRASKWI